MKRDTLELRRIFGRRINALDTLWGLVKQESLNSEMRIEYAAQIAVILRSLFCFDSKGVPLIESSGLKDELLFPFRSSIEVYNVLKETLLVNYSLSGNMCCFSATTLSADNVPQSYLSFFSWINEIVIDLKMAGYPPLTRAEIIKTVADKDGAHVDVKLDKFSSALSNGSVGFIKIINNGEECAFDCSNLLIESIFSIANEVLFSFRYLQKPVLSSPSPSSFRLNVFDFSDEGRIRYKYSICSAIVNNHSTNSFYPCKISSFDLVSYKLLFRRRYFLVNVVNVENLLV